MKKTVLGVLLAVATLLVGANVAAAQTSPLKLVTPESGTRWQIGNMHTISWTPNPDSSDIEAFLETKKGKTFTKYAQIIPCAKGSIVWCGDIDKNLTNGVSYHDSDDWSAATPGGYYLSIVDKVTGAIARTKNEIKLVPYGDVIKLDVTVHPSKDRKIKVKENTAVTLKERKITLSWQALTGSSCLVTISPQNEDGLVTYKNLERHATKRSFTLPGTDSEYGVKVFCKKGENEQTKYISVTIEGTVANVPVIDYVQGMDEDRNVIHAEEDFVMYGSNLKFRFNTGSFDGTQAYIIASNGDKLYFEPGQNSQGQLIMLAFNDGYLPDGEYVLYAQNGNLISNGVRITYDNETQISSCPFTRDLTIGSSGSDVVALQSILEAKGWLVMQAGEAKGYFGASTQTALANYQNAAGIFPADGFFGWTTRAFIAEAECGMHLEDELLVVEGLQVDADSGDGIGMFTFDIELSAIGEDFFIPVSSGSSSDNVGFDWRIVGSAAAPLTTIVVQADAEILDGEYEIKEGTTETFTVSLFVKPTMAGSYYAVLEDLTYGQAPRSISPERMVFIPSSTYDTPVVSITPEYSSMSPAASTFASSGTGYGPYSAMAALPDLKAGDTHEGVAAIQRFLNANGFQVAAPGQPGSVGNESTYFGQGTQKALASYQASKGISPAYGVFGPKTRAAISSTQN